MSDKDQAETLQLSPPKMLIPQLQVKKVCLFNSVPPKELAMVPGPSGPALVPVKRTKAQVAKKRRKFQNMKNKKKAGKLMACEQHGLAKYSTPTLDPEAANKSPQPTPVVGMEAQVAKKRRKFQNMKNKKKAGKLMACEQHGLAKYSTPTLDPEAANKSPQPTPVVGMEVDQPETKRITSDVLVPFKRQEQPHRESKEPKWLNYLSQILEDK